MECLQRELLNVFYLLRKISLTPYVLKVPSLKAMALQGGKLMLMNRDVKEFHSFYACENDVNLIVCRFEILCLSSQPVLNLFFPSLHSVLIENHEHIIKLR